MSFSDIESPEFDPLRANDALVAGMLGSAFMSATHELYGNSGPHVAMAHHFTIQIPLGFAVPEAESVGEGEQRPDTMSRMEALLGKYLLAGEAGEVWMRFEEEGALSLHPALELSAESSGGFFELPFGSSFRMIWKRSEAKPTIVLPSCEGILTRYLPNGVLKQPDGEMAEIPSSSFPAADCNADLTRTSVENPLFFSLNGIALLTPYDEAEREKLVEMLFRAAQAMAGAVLAPFAVVTIDQHVSRQTSVVAWVVKCQKQEIGDNDQS